MKKYLLTFLVVLNSLIMSLSADEGFCCRSSNQGFYVGAIGGINWMDIDSFVVHESFDDGVTAYEYTHRARLHMKTGFLAGGVIGYKFCPVYSCCFFDLSPRVEAEIAFRQNKTSHLSFMGVSVDTDVLCNSFNVRQMTYMTNFLVDVDFGMPVVPFVGVGIGYAHGWTSGTSVKNDRFAYQAIVGFSYELCDQVDFSVDYHFLKSLKHIDNHAVCFGLKKYF